jgi:hypothetical protein
VTELVWPDDPARFRTQVKPLLAVPLLAAAAVALGGCVAGMAASAVGMAARSAAGRPEGNETRKPEALSACSAMAAKHGEVHIIDVQQRTPSKIIVWGTVQQANARQSFECAFGTRVTGFKLRAIKPVR